jgi:hypothetical protein
VAELVTPAEQLTATLRALVACASHLTALGRPDLSPLGDYGDLIECPRCEGQTYDRGSCPLCRNVGMLDANGEAIQISDFATPDSEVHPRQSGAVSPLPWRVAGRVLYAANDSVVGEGAIRSADNALIVEAVNRLTEHQESVRDLFDAAKGDGLI